MPFKKIIILLLSLLILLSALTGCSYDEDFALYFELSEEPTTLDPQLASTASEEILVRNLFEGLCRLDQDGKAVNGAAEKTDISLDGLRYTFKIREDARWQDETPVTAEDFVLGFERALAPETKSPKAALLYCIKNAEAINTGKTTEGLGVKALDSKTLEITLKEKNPDFLNILTSSVAMPCNSKVFNDAKGKYGLDAENIACNGSFSLKKWEKGEAFSIRINKNEYYEGPFESKASAVIFNKDDISGRAAKVNEGNVDFGFVNLKDVKENTGIYTFSRTHYALVINRSSDVGNDNFRNAFKLALNPKAITGNVFTSTPLLIPNAIVKDGKAVKELLDATEGSQDTKSAYDFYLKGIKETEKPKSITILYSNEKGVEDLARIIAEDFQKALGAVINLKAAENEAALFGSVAAGDYQLALVPITASGSDSISYLSKFISESSENIFSFKSKKFDEAIAKLTPLSDINEIKSTVSTGLKLIAKENFILPIADYNEAFGYSKGYTCPKIFPFNGVVDLALVDIKK